MAQVKKKTVHDAIVRSATHLFSKNGYHATTVNAIAGRARLGIGNVYAYFPSKLHLLYEVYRPWFQALMEELEAEIAALPTPREKLKRLILGLWHDFPASHPNLANSLMEALASDETETGKPSDLLRWTEARITGMLANILPDAMQPLLERNQLAHVLLMAQDGFVINHRWGDTRDVEDIADKFSRLLLGEPSGSSGRGIAKKSITKNRR
jgi:AcrR family transcriptional regulator